jgi:hypothetical protein
VDSAELREMLEEVALTRMAHNDQFVYPTDKRIEAAKALALLDIAAALRKDT